MANSSFVADVKNKIIRELIRDNSILVALDSPELSPTTPEKYVNQYIFNYHQNPYTQKLVSTFITVQIHIPRSYDANRTFVAPIVEIWIISHERHMAVNEIPKVTANRNDYLSILIDEKLNGKDGFGIGKLKLRSNIEGAFQQDYLYRKMEFEGTDLNDSMCIEE